MTPLRAARTKRKLTQRQLAAAVGVSQAHISAVENGMDRASPELAEKLVTVIGRPLITEEKILYPERFAPVRKKL